MPEFVYALHDFTPEHEDEINFKAGDRIEVIEKDDLYGDGWWQGRNLSGKVGLFPQSYTSATPANPVPISDIRTPTLHPLAEESAEDIASLTPEARPAALQTEVSSSVNTNTANSADTVMSATLTDVQRAIEQLAARRETDDTSRSFSFASTNHDTESESEADRHEDDEQHQWHRDARRTLAERAQVENTRREREEEALLGLPPPPVLDIPPISAEVSDESDVENEDEDEEDGKVDQTDLHHERIETGATDVTVVPQPLPSLVAPIPEPAQVTAQPILEVLTAATSTPSGTLRSDVYDTTGPLTSVSTAANIPLPKTPAVTSTAHSPQPSLSQQLSIQTPYLGLPGPTTSVMQTPQSATTITSYNADLSSSATELSSPPQPPINQVSPSSLSPQISKVQPIMSPLSQISQPFSPSARSSSPPPSAGSAFRQTHPSDWSVEQVVDWLKTKGIDDATCSKFIEHEITGDVLLELDTAMLKDEMGIVALGKRMRIQNGIVELKRPVSASMPILNGSPSSYGHGMMVDGVSNTAAIQQQQMYNFNGIPVPSMQHVANMTQVQAAMTAATSSPALSGSVSNPSFAYAGTVGNGGSGSGRTPSIESPSTMPGTGSPYAGSVVSEELNNGTSKDAQQVLQLPKSRPSHLKFSPSDGAIGSGIAIELSPSREIDITSDRDEDKDVQSEKRRFFGLSTESGVSSGSRKSGESRDKPSAPATPRSGSVRLGPGVFAATLRSRSPTPVGARISVESTGTTGTDNNRAADDSLIVVSGAPSPSKSPSPHLSVTTGKHAKNKKSFDGGLAGMFGKDKIAVDEKKEGQREKDNKDKERVKGSGDRSSFFGNGMSLGRSRKPAPRYSLYDVDAAGAASAEKDKHRSISRYLTSSIGFSSSSGGGENGSGMEKKEKKKKNARPGTAPSGNGNKPVPFGQSELDASPSSPVTETQLPFSTKDDSHVGPSTSPTNSLLRKRHVSTTGPLSPSAMSTKMSPLSPASRRSLHEIAAGGSVRAKPLGASTKAEKVNFQAGESVLDQIGQPDYAGWLKKKGEKYNAWKSRYLVLKGPHLYYLKDADRMATKIKGYVKVQGYKVLTDESGPGKYGFKIIHETEPTHYFCSEELLTTREWMKALMKATIERDYSKPVISSCNIPTIPLVVAQTMNPGPRPPSPTARDATQRALRRENPNQLSTRDARVLMGLPSTTVDTSVTNDSKSITDGRPEAGDTFFMAQPLTPPPPHTPIVDEEATLVSIAASFTAKTVGSIPPKRPSREARNPSSTGSINSKLNSHANNAIASGYVAIDNSWDVELVEWANSLLPSQYKINNVSTDFSSGLVLLRLAEAIKGRPSEPPVPDSLFIEDNNLDGMFKLFDFLLDNEIKMGSVSINDIKHGRWDKVEQLLKALRAWGEKRKAPTRSVTRGISQAGPWIATESA